ncbi:unnamed protein product [Ambrosiozyma monospora]|uniref:Unnamed protein product n=1 Tax=Ambrosiozyma monospora TaxID=43982 RepID=A0ACB5SWX2_AMBMO|nr:unnamed protein product [Ambrosiozyma monospora]
MFSGIRNHISRTNSHKKSSNISNSNSNSKTNLNGVSFDLIGVNMNTTTNPSISDTSSLLLAENLKQLDEVSRDTVKQTQQQHGFETAVTTITSPSPVSSNIGGAGGAGGLFSGNGHSNESGSGSLSLRLASKSTAGLLKSSGGGLSRSRSNSVSSPLFNTQQVPFPGQQQTQQSQQQKRQQQQPMIRQRSLSTLTKDERLQIQSVENFLKLEDDLLATVEDLPLNFLKRQLVRNLICSLFKFFKSKVGTGDDGTRLIDIDNALLYNDIQVVVNNLISVIYTMDESGAASGGVQQTSSSKSRNVGSGDDQKTLQRASTVPSIAIGRSTGTRNQENEKDDDNDNDNTEKDTVAAGEFDDAENEVTLLGNRFSRLFDNRSSVGTRSRSRSFKSYTSGINTPYRYHTPGPVTTAGGVGVAHSVSHSHAPSLAQSVYSVPGISSPEPFYQQQQTPHLQYQQQQQQHMMQQQLTGTGSMRFDLQPLPQQPPPPQQQQQQLLAQHQAAYLPTPTAHRGMPPPQGSAQLMGSTPAGLYSEPPQPPALVQPQHLVFKNVTGGSQIPMGSPNANGFVYGAGPAGGAGVAGTPVSGPYGNPRYSVSQLSVNPYVDVYYQ